MGSSQSIADPLVAPFNTAIAESCDYVATRLETARSPPAEKLNAAVQEVLAEIIQQHGAVVFDGNGYSAEWHMEAEKRGLPNYKTAVDALPVTAAEGGHRAVRTQYKVLSPRELHSRYDTYLEHYSKSVNVEANLTAKIAKTIILPAAMQYQTDLAKNATAVKAAGFVADTTVLTQVTELISKLQAGLAGLEAATSHHGGGDALAEAKHFGGSVVPAMLKVREPADGLEAVVADDLWPLPTLQEILFIK